MPVASMSRNADPRPHRLAAELVTKAPDRPVADAGTAAARSHSALQAAPRAQRPRGEEQGAVHPGRDRLVPVAEHDRVHRPQAPQQRPAEPAAVGQGAAGEYGGGHDRDVDRASPVAVHQPDAPAGDRDHGRLGQGEALEPVVIAAHRDHRRDAAEVVEHRGHAEVARVQDQVASLQRLESRLRDLVHELTDVGVGDDPDPRDARRAQQR